MEAKKLKIDENWGKFESVSLPKYKSKMTVGSMVIMNVKKFNWLQKIFWKILLGIKIEDIKE